MAAAPTTPATPSPQAPSRPDWLPESHWDAKANKIADTFGEHFNQLSAFKAAEDVRRGSLPAPDAYKLELPKDFKMPVGSGEWQWNDKDPLLGQARTIAHELGIPQEGFSKLLGLYVASKTGDAAEFKAATEAEIGKLGTNSSARVDAVTRWMEANGFKEMPKMLVTAGMVREFEALITKSLSGGAAPFSQANRDPQGGQRLSTEEYSKLTYAQKQEYARKFPQNTDRARPPTAA